MGIVKLSEISVGASSGENEVEVEFFKDMFYKDNQKYEQIKNYNKFIVCGRKGTGKSLLALYYKDEKEAEKSYNFVHHIKMNSMQDREEVVDLGLDAEIKIRKLFQEYYILKKIVDTIELIDMKFPSSYVGKHSLFGINFLKLTKFKKAKRKLLEFYSQLYPDGIYHEFKVKTEIGSKKKVDIAEDSSISVGLSARNTTLGVKTETGKIESDQQSISSDFIFEKKKFYQNVDELESKILEVLKYVNIEIFFDDFDEISDLSDVERDEYLSSFIDKTQGINLKFRTRKMKSRIILLIRDDFLVNLNLTRPNMQKIINDSLIELDWDATNNKNILTNMILNKIRMSNAQLRKMKLSEVRSLIFPEFKYVENSKNEITSDGLKEIMKYTLHRPRDFVVFINEIFKSFPEDSCITDNMVNSCLKPYSEALLGEVQNEMNSHYDKVKINQCLYMLSLYGKKSFSIEQIFEKSRVTLNYLTLEGCRENLEILYRFNVIGNKNRNKTAMITMYSFNYRNYNPSPLNIDERMEIHRGFCKGLNIG